MARQSSPSQKGRTGKQKHSASRKAQRAPRDRQALPRGRFAKTLYILSALFIWALVIMVPVVIYFALDLPDISKITQKPGRATIMVMDRQGERLASYGDVYGEWLEYDEVPISYIQALIATEDRRFFSHAGLDLRGVARALVRNIQRGDVVEGGSTITQQLAKNLFLSPERTVKRKVQEMMLSFWLEMNFSKQEIMTLYINRVYYGGGAYGLDAAARTIFGHDGRNLTLTEAAMLVGMLKGPALYSPLRDVERAYRRTEEVLDNMVEAGFIQPATAAAAKKANVTLAEQVVSNNVRYFTDWVVEQLPDLIGPVEEPIVVYTTLVSEIQAMATGALQQVMDRDGPVLKAEQAALVSMDMDGAIRAMVGGRDYAESQFNRVTQARRQPGSAFKLFVYLAALERGFGPETVLRDSPVSLGGWEPKNYSGTYRGEVTLAEAFEQSINTVAVKLAEKVNRRTVAAMARRLGLSSPLVEEPSLALGTSEVSLLELTAAYAVVGNGGYEVNPYGIVEIQNSTGQILYRHMPGPPRRLLSEEVAATMQQMLSRVVENGTARAARLGFPVAGKTGTTQDYKDALFVGYAKNMINGIWVGNDQATPTAGVTGGGTPARIWKNFMIRVSLGRNDATLTTPDVRPRNKPSPDGPPPDKSEL